MLCLVQNAALPFASSINIPASIYGEYLMLFREISTDPVNLSGLFARRLCAVRYSAVIRS